jgi:hypothetical protein
VYSVPHVFGKGTLIHAFRALHIYGYRDIYRYIYNLDIDTSIYMLYLYGYIHMCTCTCFERQCQWQCRASAGALPGQCRCPTGPVPVPGQCRACCAAISARSCRSSSRACEVRYSQGTRGDSGALEGRSRVLTAQLPLQLAPRHGAVLQRAHAAHRRNADGVGKVADDATTRACGRACTP